MPQVVDFDKVSTVGLDSSPFAEALAGLRANEARYYRNKYGHVFAVNPASEATEKKCRRPRGPISCACQGARR